MAFFRIEKTQNYTVMSNYHLKDMGLSLKAKGLLSIMLSLPDEWEFSLNGLVVLCKESETAIKNTLKELKDAGYVEIIKERTDKGTYAYIYNVYEVSKQSQKPQVENPGVDELRVDNDTQLNTKELNTKELNTENINIEVEKPQKRFIPPTVDEVQTYCKERGNNVDSNAFVDFYKSKGWMVGKSKMKDWKACVRTWEQRDRKEKKEKNKISTERTYNYNDLESKLLRR